MTSADKDPIVVAGMARTPIGGFAGGLAPMSAPEIGSCAIEAAVERAGISKEDVTELLMGCVLPAGLGQAPARQASLAAGVPESVPCTTVNKVCGSGMKTVMMAYDSLQVRPGDIYVAGGMESMTNAPYLMPKARAGFRLGHGRVLDSMFVDGLEDAYDNGRLMGTFAEDTAEHFQITREAQDDYAIESLKRARRANEDGTFDAETVRVQVNAGRARTELAHDEQPFAADPAKIPGLKPVFREGGTVTPANASSISDGAAALVVMRAGEAERRGLTPLARVVGCASFAHEPAWFSTAPVYAIKAVLEQVGWSKSEVDLYEINEAFAVVALAVIQGVGLTHDVVNVHGGACALGHPIGASGARIIVTLIGAMLKHDARRGVASLCIGGGEATAIALERMH